MEKVHQSNSLTWYKHNGSFFSVWDFSDLTEPEIRDRIKEPKLPDYCEKTFEEKAKQPLRVFNISKIDTRPLNMSLYEFLVLIKCEANVPPALKSCCMQQDYDPLIFACEPFDEESDLTDKNLNIINDYIKRYAKELMEIAGKDGYEVEVYR